MIIDSKHCQLIHQILDKIIVDVEEELSTEEFQEFCDDIVPIRETINKIEVRKFKTES